MHPSIVDLSTLIKLSYDLSKSPSNFEIQFTFSDGFIISFKIIWYFFVVILNGVCDGITTVMVCNGILIYDVCRTSYIVTVSKVCSQLDVSKFRFVCVK